MSHVIEGSLKVLDLGAMSDAAQVADMTFKEGQKTFKWYGSYVGDYRNADAAARRGYDPAKFGHCDHAIVVNDAKPNTYEIGVVPAKDGVGWALLYDNWHGGYGLEDVAGRSLERLNQEYGAAVANRHLMSEGMAVTRSIDVDGNIVLEGVSLR